MAKTKAVPQADRIETRIGFPDPAGHRIEVEVSFVAPVDRPELVFATWTPGSYLIREYARQVEDFSATGDSRNIGWRKTAKNRWALEADAGQRVTARYRVYSRELSVRTPFVDPSRAFLVPAALVPFVRGGEGWSYRLEVAAPTGWQVDVALPEEKGGGGRVFLARDFDHLVDSPVEVGRHRRHDLRIDGIPHRITVAGDGNADEKRIVRDFEGIVRESAKIFGGLPYERYLLILHLLGSNRGGLEHRDSAVCDFPRLNFTPEKEYEEFVGLVAHEFFHTWNVKRIRPAAFVPYDYENENYTRLLWAMEGTTSYYEWLILVRSGLMGRERYLARLADKINSLRAQPGRGRKPVAESSFDTWIKAYRPDENSPNSTISYYEKGEQVALLLDLAIREATSGKRSYDDLFRLLWRQYGRTGKGIPEEGYRAAAEQVAGVSLRPFWNRWVDGTAEFDWDRSLASFGLKVVWKEPDGNGWIGVKTKNDAGRLILETVFDGGPAWRASLSAGDEVVALSGYRVDPDNFGRRVEQVGARGATDITVFRDQKLLTLPLVVGEKPRTVVRIEDDPAAPAAAKKMGRAWLPAPPAKKPAKRAPRR